MAAVLASMGAAGCSAPAVSGVMAAVLASFGCLRCTGCGTGIYGCGWLHCFGCLQKDGCGTGIYGCGWLFCCGYSTRAIRMSAAAVSYGIIAAVEILTFTLPLYITYAYQLIPVPVRRLWGMRGSGSSHILVTAAMTGGIRNLWPLFFQCCSGVVYLPGYLLGSICRITGLTKTARVRETACTDTSWLPTDTWIK